MSPSGKRVGAAFAALFGVFLVGLGAVVAGLAFIAEPASGWALNLLIEAVWIGIGLGVAIVGVNLVATAAREARDVHRI